MVGNIEVNISLKIRNIIGGGFAARMNMFKKQETNQTTSGVISTGISMKERLKLFNSKTLQWNSNKTNNNSININISTVDTNTNIKNDSSNNDKEKKEKETNDKKNINKAKTINDKNKEETKEKEIKKEEKVKKESKTPEENKPQSKNKVNNLEKAVNKVEEKPKMQINKEKNISTKVITEEKKEKNIIKKNTENINKSKKEEKVKAKVKMTEVKKENLDDKKNNKDKIIPKENKTKEKKLNISENKNKNIIKNITEKNNIYKDEWEYDDDSLNDEQELIYQETSSIIEEDNEESPEQSNEINETNKKELIKEIELETKQEKETIENKEEINESETNEQINNEKEEIMQELKDEVNINNNNKEEIPETFIKEKDTIKKNIPIQVKKRQSYQFTSTDFINKLSQNVQNKQSQKKLEPNQLEMICDQMSKMSKDENESQKEEEFPIKKSPILNPEKRDILMRGQTFMEKPRAQSIVLDLGFEILDIYNVKSNSTQSAKSNTLTPQSQIQSQSLPEKTLSSIKYDEYLSKLELEGIKEIPHETFCEGFFIASFPEKGGQVIENSSNIFALCGHKECSELPSMKPEIIMRYPLKDTKNLELNNLAATICFPTGIKMCYSQDEPPKQIKDYVTQITNQKGERYYMRTFHFYKKMNNNSFINRYEIYPLKHHLNKFLDGFLFLKEEEYTEEITENIQKNLEHFQNFNNLDIVYIPCCLSLITKYPYTLELEKCLNTIYNIMKTSTVSLNFEINDLIMYLIHSIPIPEKNMKIQFYIPYCPNPKIEIECPKEDDISIMNNNHITLFNYLSADNIVLIFRLLLSEKKLLFIHDDYTELTNITNSFISLLYPFKWIHTYIPIMSDQMLKYLETFLPFLNGINISLINLVEQTFKESEIEDNEEVFLIYVKTDEIILSSSFTKNKNKLFKYIQSNLPPLPFEKELKKELKNIEYYKKRLKKEVIENNIRDSFMNFFVKIFYDYEKYIVTVDNDVVFNKVLFIQNRPDKEEKTEQFYEEFIDSQLFQQFLQCLPNSDNSYFKRRIKEFKEKEKENKNSKNKNTLNEINNNQVITYFAKPYLGLDGQEITNIENILENYKINKEKEKYDKDVKILEKDFSIDNDKYINSKCLIYLNPEENSENKEKFKLSKKKNKNVEGKLEKTNEKQIELIKENIKDVVISIFKSEIESGENKSLKKKVFSNLETSEGREFFISLISNNTNQKMISLEENSFTFLEELIRGILNSVLKLEETEQLFEEIVLLIKSTKYYETVLTFEKIHINMYKNLKNFLHRYNKITQNNLWQKWFSLELGNKMKESPDEVNNKKKIILDICQNLIDLVIPKSTIKNIVESINKIAFGDDKELFEILVKEYTDLITNANYS